MSSSSASQSIPQVDYFSLVAQKTQESNPSTSPSFTWDSSPYNDSALISSDSCNSTLPSPTSPSSQVFPSNTYGLPKDGFDKTEFESEQAFDFGSFGDWMRWDDPSDAALSPAADKLFPDLKTEPISPKLSDLELQTGGVAMSGMNPDDCAIFGDDSLMDGTLFQSPSAFIREMPPREGLYSTPLSWTRPAPGPRPSPNVYTSALTPQEEARLRDIAMPNRTKSQDQCPASPDSASSPEPYTDNHKKRKSSMEDDEDEEGFEPSSTGKHSTVKKTAHNMIEKRYRTNLNDKIARLRDSVPSLRVMSKKNSRGGDVQEDLQGLTPAHKLNKATVLSKATEYIAHLEKRNRYLERENRALKSRVDAFEILVSSRQAPGQQQQQLQRQHNPSSRRQSSNGYMV